MFELPLLSPAGLSLLNETNWSSKVAVEFIVPVMVVVEVVVLLEVVVVVVEVTCVEYIRLEKTRRQRERGREIEQ